MHIAFVHNSFPGHFGALAAKLIKLSGDQCSFLAHNVQQERIMGIDVYPSGTDVIDDVRAGRDLDPVGSLSEVRRRTRMSLQSVKTLQEVSEASPVDVFVVHADWGSSSALKRHFPDVPVVTYLEQYVAPGNLVFDFRVGDPDAGGIDSRLLTDVQNMCRLYDSLEVEGTWAPTRWTKACLPLPVSQDEHVFVQHEGIDTAFWQPASDALVEAAGLPESVTKAKKLVTYVNRDFEFAKGFDVFMRAAKEVYTKDPDVHFACVGRPGAAYNMKIDDEVSRMSFKDWVLEQDTYDLGRFTFIDTVEPVALTALFRFSKCHVYLSAPMVLGWSVLNAMSCGVPVVASRTGAVPEVIKHGENGYTPPFNDWRLIADCVQDVLGLSSSKWRSLSQAAHDTIALEYDFKVTAPRMHSYLKSIVDGHGRSPRSTT